MDVNKKFEIESQSKPIIISALLVSALFALIFAVNHIGQELLFLITHGITGYNDANIFHAPDIRYIKNIPNLVYCLQALFMLLLPVCICITQKTMRFKTVLLKILCYAIAASYFIGNFWVFKWLYMGLFSGEGFMLNLKEFQDTQCYIYNHMSWGYNSGFSIFINLLCGVSWLFVGKNVDRKYRKMYFYLIWSVAASFVLPMLVFIVRYLMSLIAPDVFLSGDELLKQLGISIVNDEIRYWWLTKSIFLLFSHLALVFVFIYSSQNRERYESNICEINIMYDDDYDDDDEDDEYRSHHHSSRHSSGGSGHHRSHHRSSSSDGSGHHRSHHRSSSSDGSGHHKSHHRSSSSDGSGHHSSHHHSSSSDGSGHHSSHHHSSSSDGSGHRRSHHRSSGSSDNSEYRRSHRNRSESSLDGGEYRSSRYRSDADEYRESEHKSENTDRYRSSRTQINWMPVSGYDENGVKIEIGNDVPEVDGEGITIKEIMKQKSTAEETPEKIVKEYKAPSRIEPPAYVTNEEKKDDLENFQSSGEVIPATFSNNTAKNDVEQGDIVWISKN